MDVGKRAAFCSADARSQEETQALIDFALDRYGRIDILVNNAGARVASHRCTSSAMTPGGRPTIRS